jgi:hypothetical protein
VTTPVLDDFGFQYGTSGLVLNDLALGDGTYLDITQVDGLDSAPAKNSSASFEDRDGGVINAVFEDIRKIKIAGTLYAGSNPLFQTIDLLKANYAIGQDPQPLFFKQWGTLLRQVFCKSLGFNYSWTAVMRTGQTPFSIDLQAEDPTIYGTTLNTPVGVLQPSGSQPGYSWSRPWSYSWGGGIPFGQTLLTNNGTKYGGFYATIQNYAVTHPRIISDTANSYVSTSLTIGSTDVLVFDFYNQSLFLNGQSVHAAVVNEGWFKLLPGVNSVRLLSDSSTAAQITYSYYDAYR